MVFYPFSTLIHNAGKVVAMIFAPVRDFVKVHKKKIGLVQSVGISLILWIKLSSSIKKGTFELIA